MNQKLSDWASIAEIVSGIAVLVTLIFLIIGIRENSAVTRADSFSRSIDGLNEWRLAIAQDAELARLIGVYFSGNVEELSRDDIRRVQALLATQWTIYETSYYSNRTGILGDSEWSRFEYQICLNYSPEDREGWHRFVEDRLTTEFAAFVVNQCSAQR